MLPFRALPQTVFALALRFIVLTSLFKSFLCYSAAEAGATGTADRCGKMFLRHSIVLFFRIVSLVTPELGWQTAERTASAALRRLTPSYRWASLNSKSFMTSSNCWHTMSFKSLATVVVMSRTLPPKLRALIFPALFVESTEAV